MRVAMLESSPDNYIKLDFELLRIELREFEALVYQLKDSLNSTSPLFDSLYTEVRHSRLSFSASAILLVICQLCLSVLDSQHDPHCEPTGDF